MGANSARPNIDQAQYQSQFKATSQDCQNAPKENRGCQDICCLITFIIFTLMFVIAGVYFISTMKTDRIQNFTNSFATSNSTSKSTLTTTKHQLFYETDSHMQVGMPSGIAHTSNSFPSLSSAIPYILMMGLLSLILSVVLVIAISKVPKVVVYGTIIITFILIIAGLIGGIVIGEPSLAIICGIFGLVWGILVAVMFCCWRQQFEAAIVLLKVTGNFLKSKPAILLAPLLTMFISFFYFVFWLISFAAIQLNRSPQAFDSTKQHQFDAYDAFSMIWLFFSLFYSYFFYYVMVFLIATATALWYYNIDGNYIITGLKNIWSSHIGSLTFASLMVTIVSTLKSAANNNNNGDQNGCAIVCLCIVKCCLSFLEDLIKTLNHNAVIVMSVKGEGFIESAKTAIYLIFNYFGIFISVEMVEFLLNLCVFFITIVTPTALGLLLLKLTYNQSAADQGVYLFVATAAIFIICLMVSLLTITILSQTLSSVFIFYCLNQQFRRLNYGSVNRVPQQLQSMFAQIEEQGGQEGNQFDNSRNVEPSNNGYNPVPPPQNNYNQPQYNFNNQPPSNYNNQPYNSGFNQPPRQPSYNGNPYNYNSSNKPYNY